MAHSRVRRLLAVALALMAPALHAGDAATPGDASPVAVSLGTHTTVPESAAQPWTWTSLASQGSLSGGRADWREYQTEVLHRVRPGLYGGARLESRDHGGEADTLYTALFSHTLGAGFEWHGWMRFASDPLFSAEQAYSVGAHWRAAPAFSLLLDVGTLEFPAGRLEQYTPGAVAWLSDWTYLTYRYVYGRAFGQDDYDWHVVRLDLGDGGPLRAALSAGHGTDPEKDVAMAAPLLTDADVVSAFLHWRVGARLEAIAGAEYEDRADLYTRMTGTVGLSVRF